MENNIVFINCPFDEDYIRRLLKPMLYVLIKLGFEPKLALLTSNSNENRLDKIVRCIEESDLSIHDLSKIKAEKEGEFSRLNMPFELGVDYGFMKAKYHNKKFLVVGSYEHEYKIALSDFSGFDIKYHKNDTKEIIDCIRTWCTDNIGLKNVITSSNLFENYTDFNSALFKIIFNKLRQKNQSKKKSKENAHEDINRMTVSEYINKVKDSL
jgi:hypothetical protein